MSNQLLESIIKLRIGMFAVRIWRQEDVELEIDNSDIIGDRTLKGMNDMQLIADYIGQLARVNAVEVTMDGAGIVLYNDWP